MFQDQDEIFAEPGGLQLGEFYIIMVITIVRGINTLTKGSLQIYNNKNSPSGLSRAERGEK